MEGKFILAIVIGAALGALSRAYLALWLNSWSSFLNLGTLIANIVGCFLIGICVSLILYWKISPLWQHLLVTGFLGSLTTFSSYSGEVVQKLFNGAWLQALGITLIHLSLGFLSTGIAIWLTRMIINNFK